MEERPSETMIPRVMGIFLIVFAGLGLIFTAASLNKPGTLSGIRVIQAHVGALKTYQLTAGITGMVVLALELWAGILAVTYHRWAPRVCALYCAAGLVRVAALVWLYFGTVAPIAKNVSWELWRSYNFGVIFQHCVLLCWIVLVGVLMQRKDVRLSCNR